MAEVEDVTELDEQELSNPPLEVPIPVANALTRFADATRRLAMWESGGWSLTVLIGLFTLIAFADRFQWMGDDTRKAAALLGYAAVLGVAGFLIARALRRRTPAEIALALEDRVPGNALQERISSTVELANRSKLPAQDELEGGISTILISRVADEAAQLIEEIDIEELPDRAAAIRAGKFSAGALVAMVLLCLIPGFHMAAFYGRALLPWQRLQRPSATKISVLPGDARVVEGATLDVETSLSGQLVKDAVVETRDQNSSAWLPSAMEPDAAHPDRFTLKVGPMRANMDYRVRAGDGMTNEYHITVMSRPEITNLKITIHYPPYTELKPETFERISGDLSVLKGSKVELSVKSNTNLSAAVLEFSNDRRVSMTTNQGAADASFDVTEDTQYRIQLRSNDGVSNPDAPLFSIRAVPDKAPQVAVIKPLADDTTDPGTLLNLEARAEDDFGLTSMRLVVKSDQQPKTTTIKLSRPEEGGKVWLISQPWDLAGLFLQDGETIVYRVEAVDTSGTIGKSDERRLRIVSAQKHPSAHVLAELEKVQKNLDGAHRLMSSARKDVGEMRQLFRPEDTEFQAAERLLLEESFRRIARETQSASDVLEKIAPEAETGPMRVLVTGLSNALARFSSTELRPLQSSALRAHSNNTQAIAAALDVLFTQAPPLEERITFLHQAASVAQRYAGSMVLEERATDIRDSQVKITPVLVGAAAWSPKGTFIPGLTAEYYKGINFEQLVRRTVESRILFANTDLPDVGRDNFSVRWKGQVLAPKAGRYVFRATADDGVRLTVAGKKLIDEWKAQAPTAFEGPIDLTEGWHDIVLEYFQGSGGFEIKLERSGPKMETAAIPAVQLRTIGTVVAATPDNVRDDMGKGASDNAVQQGLVRLQTMLQAAQSLSPDLTRLAGLPPEKDVEVAKLAEGWGKEVTKYSSELISVKTLNPALATPLSTWQEHTRGLAHRYAEIRVRYKHIVDEWARKFSNDVFEESAKLKQLQQAAEAAKKAFEELANAAKQPKDEKRAAAMERADAMVRALSEDLQTQAKEIAADFKKEAEDTQRPLEERRVLQALEHKAEMMALDPGEALERRLAESKTPEALAQSQEKTPNFGTKAAELSQKAGELAQAAEKMERAVALREALKELATDNVEAREAIQDAPTAENAAKEQRAAAELKEDAGELKQALEAAKAVVDPNALAKVQQISDQASASKVAEVMERRAQKTLNGELNTKKDSSDTKKAEAAAKELGEQAKKANEAAETINKELANQAQQLNGDAANTLREAAKDLTQSSQALAEAAKQPKDPAAALDRAAAEAQQAEERAANTAERLALDAEAARKAATTDEQRAKADDLVRLAAAVHNEVEKQIAPVAENLDRAQKNPEAVAVAEGAQEQEKAEANKLNKLADIAAQLSNPDANQQKQGREALNKVLAEQGEAANVEKALQQANALDKVAAELTKADAALQNAADAEQKAADAQQNAQASNDAKQNAEAAKQNAEATKQAAEAAKQAAQAEAGLDAAEKELAKDIGADAKEAAKEAMAGQLNELAQELRQEAERERQSANHLNQAAALEQQARDNLKKESPALAQALKDAQKNAASAAKGKAPEAAQPLNAAQQELGQAGDATAAEGKKADSAPLEQLAADLNKIAKDIEKPVGEVAAALGKIPDEQSQQDAQRAGREARNAAGRAAELAEEMKRADRAGDLAQAGAQEAGGDRQQLEGEVKAALKALEKEGGAPAAEVAELQKSLAQGEQNAKGNAGEKQGQQGEQAGQKGQEAGQQAGQQGQQGQQAGQQGQQAGQQGKQAGQQAGQQGQQAGQQGQQAGQQGQQGGQQSEQSMQLAAEKANADADRLAQMAAQVEKLAAAIAPEGASAPGKSAQNGKVAQNGLPTQPSRTPAGDALDAVAQAEAALQTGDTAEAAQLTQQAENLLAQAAEAARSQATGNPTPGNSEAQSNAQGEQGQAQGQQGQGKGKGKSEAKNKSKSDGQGSSGKGSAAQSKGTLAPEPPAGIPIDKATWNKLPDNLRRDLLNAVGGRFPAEYESSIKRYFKNVASTKEEKR
jgi:hypothetical protein